MQFFKSLKKKIQVQKWTYDLSNRNSHSLLTRMENDIANPVISSKTKHTLTTQFSSHTPWLMPQSHENLYAYKNLHKGVYNSFIWLPKFGSNQKVFQLMNELWYIQIMEYYSVLKRNELSNQEKSWTLNACYYERSKTERLYTMISNIWHSGKVKLRW